MARAAARLNGGGGRAIDVTGGGRRTGGSVVTFGGGREGVETVGGVDEGIEAVGGIDEGIEAMLTIAADEDSTFVAFTGGSVPEIWGVDCLVSSFFCARRCLICCTYRGMFTLRYSERFVPALGGWSCRNLSTMRLIC